LRIGSDSIIKDNGGIVKRNVAKRAYNKSIRGRRKRGYRNKTQAEIYCAKPALSFVGKEV
jgi:hypothetical protein